MHRQITGLALFVLLLSSGAVSALSFPAPLIDTDWLEQHLGEVKLLDVRDDIESFTRKAVLVRKRFTGDLKLRRTGAHIPGAVLVDFQNIRSSREISGNNVRRMLPEKAEFEELMQSWGINKDDAIVITSMGASSRDITMATRLYWQIKYFGHDDVSILEGGVVQWQLEEKVSSIERRETKAGNWLSSELRHSILASSDEVAASIDDETVQLVDSRSLGYYLGVIKSSSVRKKGRIPGAKIFPNELLTSAGAAPYFTDPLDIEKLATELGIDATGSIIAYCNTGQIASASWFVFSELLGNRDVKLYDGSMHQWVLEKRPLVKLKMER